MSLKYLYISLIFILSYAASAFAIAPDFYTSSSVLAQGKWAKVLVKEPGMQFISNATLRGLGFSDPDKVNVYGYGGRMLPERLDTSTPDDLPVVTSLRTPSGIIFFGTSSVGWEAKNMDDRPFAHVTNPYSDNSYYFLSDIDTQRPVAPARDEVAAIPDEPITVFNERVLHEQDLLAPSTTGRVILGEDFRTQNSRNFTFQLPDNTGEADVWIAFGAKVTNGAATLNITANGEEAPAVDNRIPGVNNSETFLNLATFSKKVAVTDDKLILNLNFSHTGVLFTAALDYIEITYRRRLQLRNDELYFYLNPEDASEVCLEGCTEATVLWDVTDPVHPQEVVLRHEGTAASFVTPQGLREYVAFNPLKVSRAAVGAGTVRNQNLHAMEAPGMLVISPEQFRAQAQKLVDIHAQTDGLSVVVVTPEEVYNEFSSGNPDVTAFRRLLKMWYDRADGDPTAYTKFCLLFSRPTYDNKMTTPIVKSAGYPRIPIWQEPNTFTDAGSFSTDDYIGMLDDQPDVLSLGNARIHVAVGRMPVKSVAEAENAMAKLEKYLLSPNLGIWRNSVMVIADDQDNGQHLDQAEKVITAMRKGENGENLIYEKLYLDAWPLGHSGQGAVYPEAKQRMMDKISEGVSLINYIGHANPRSWGHENLLTWTDITTMDNTNLPFIYAATCEFLNWDADDVSGAEEMWLNPTAGVIGMMCPSRKVYISANGTLNEKTGAWFFRRGTDGRPLPLGEIMINGKNDYASDTNKLRYGFMGDPSMRLPYPTYTAEVEKINDALVPTDFAELPELKARSKVTLTGSITNAEGSVVENFNGTVDIQLYDAEKVVETYGNGSEGAVKTYNDRKTRLYIGRAAVKNGLWETTFVMPTEIENNYSPALFSFYAVNEAGDEANGSFDRLYVYGLETEVEDDFDGPSITDFYLNNPSFIDGKAIGPNTMVYATLSDPSGINLSEAGIGHKMTISLDGKKWYDDVNLYYDPDSETYERGAISYPLSGIEPGDHSLTLTVWDTANNSSSATLNFSVRADWSPSISTLATDVNPASTSVVFNVGVDGSVGNMPCLLEVFDLGGKRVWYSEASGFSESVNSLNHRWDLRDTNGHRVARGIYLYRATITTPEGHVVTKTRKLAVTA